MQWPFGKSLQARTAVQRSLPKAQGIQTAPQLPRFDKQKISHAPGSF
jgi:hypothetical protein